MSAAEIIGVDKSNPFIRVPVDANSGVDLTETIHGLNRNGYVLGHYSVAKVEMEDSHWDVPAGMTLPVEGRSVCFHGPDCQFNLTVSPDNTCEIRTDSTPKLVRVWLLLMLEHKDRRVQL
ncbi:hypothetical protein D3C87_1826580 [compost metagenome]